MAFKASGERKVRQYSFAEGKQLIPSAADEEWYRIELAKLINEMKESYITVLSGGELPKGKAADAGIFSGYVERMKKLKEFWEKRFKKEAAKIAEQIVARTDLHSKTTANFSISTVGVKAPVQKYNEAIKRHMKASSELNTTLIEGISQEFHEKVHAAVMNSMVSPRPEEQGQPAIINAVKEAGVKSQKRAEVIARDQTSKLYSALNMERMEQNGITHFKWVHSSAGKHPRESHVKRNGEIFELNDPRLWEGPEGDQGPPGYAINCRCRAIPVLD